MHHFEEFHSVENNSTKCHSAKRLIVQQQCAECLCWECHSVAQNVDAFILMNNFGSFYYI